MNNVLSENRGHDGACPSRAAGWRMGNGFAPARRVGGYVGLVLVALLLLSALAVPGFLRALKRARAAIVLSEAGLIDAAVDQFGEDRGKRPGDAVRWEDLAPFLEAGSRLANSGGKDVCGRPYVFGRILNESTQVRVNPETVREFRDVVADPGAFWGDYLPAGGLKGSPGTADAP